MMAIRIRVAVRERAAEEVPAGAWAAVKDAEWGRAAAAGEAREAEGPAPEEPVSACAAVIRNPIGGELPAIRCNAPSAVHI